MTHFPLSDMISTRAWSTDALVRPLRVAGRAAAVVIRLPLALSRGLAGVPGAISRAFAMAYVDPYTTGRKRDDWSNPERC